MNEELRLELLRRSAADQEVRTRAMEAFKVDHGGPIPEETETALEALQSLDEDNTAWLKAIVREHGWPGRSLVGEEAANAAWLLAQHADRDPAFQRECLDLMQKAVEAGEARASAWAYLTDRVLCAEGRPRSSS